SQGTDPIAGLAAPDVLSQIPFQLRWIATLVDKSQDYERVRRQIFDVGGCAAPVWLRGRSLTFALETGVVVKEFSSNRTPFEAIPIRCMNRRASRCPSCSRLYRGDAFQLARAGMIGGKGVPESVSDHPMVFATVTAPSFGPVHRAANPDDAKDRCRVRHGFPRCPHGRVLSCAKRHAAGDPVLGQPLCADCYDYVGQVLFNAHVSALWGNLIDTVYHRLALHSGEKRARVRQLVRVEYFKIAEYQGRGVVHFHAVLRLDGPADLEPPPAWASAEVLAEAFVSAAAVASVSAPSSAAVGDRVVRFGAQVDAQPIVTGGGDDALSDAKASGYLSKYVTKGTEDAGGVDRRVTRETQINPAAKSPHVRALMHTCWRLGALPEFEHLHLREWSHMLGYGGHNASKSRRYSTTFTALRGARVAHYQGAETEVPGGVAVDSEWWFVNQGYGSPSLRAFAEQTYEDLEFSREAAREALNEERHRAA
ncbi:MAG: replication initiator, partial [Actinocrinis sp.]